LRSAFADPRDKVSTGGVRADSSRGESRWNLESDEDYLIPNRRPEAVKRAERSDKVIWETVKKIAARAGVAAHVHALRAAFAVQFDEANPAQVVALKELLGHSRIDQTRVYLRRKYKAEEEQGEGDGGRA
jgi:site-specific recombinase XerD